MNSHCFWRGWCSFRWQRVVVAALVCAVALTGCASQHGVSSDNSLLPAGGEEAALSSARQAFDVGAFEKAYSNFSAVLHIDPDNTVALLGRGASSLSLGQPEAAMADFAQVLQREPNNADAFYNLGLALFQLDRTEKAETAFSKAVERNPSFAKAYNNRGLARVRLHRTEEAIADFTRAFELQDEKAFEPIFNRAALYQNQQLYEKALADYLVAAPLQPYNVRVKNNLGIVYMQLGQLDNAQRTFDEAIAISSDDPEVRYNRAILFEKKNDYKKAIAEYDKALFDNPKMAAGYLNRGILHMRLRQTSRGCADVSKACELGICELYDTMKTKGICD
ncbi:tetratricopeptide repeat protein [Desulfovibrio inopinatus]|uniref:tetratricopeptide repeat protein n=1 Tax=Desulfovibrio inopinatus TaxID=102109 RepID=UPI00040777E0|nr:tetratricopeptide repeat protein [Desulfovibrio inopinatus]